MLTSDGRCFQDGTDPVDVRHIVDRELRDKDPSMDAVANEALADQDTYSFTNSVARHAHRSCECNLTEWRSWLQLSAKDPPTNGLGNLISGACAFDQQVV